MGEKTEQRLSRLELANFLQNLSEQLRRGVLEVQGRHWTVPEDLEVQMELKEKKGRLGAKLGWFWSTLAEYDGASRQEISRGQDSMKSVKKRLSADFKALQQAVGQGAWPDDRLLGNFAESSRALAAMAEPEWQSAMQEYLDHLANLEHAVASQQREVMLHELRDLSNGMAACHREFKSRGGAGKG